MQAEGRAPLSGDEVASAPESAEPGAARRQTRLVFIVAGIVVLLDQVSKAVIVATMADREPIELLGGLLTITYTRNPGAAFSIGTGYTWIFTLVAIAVVVIIIRTSRHLYSAAWAVALGGLLGGALGNLIDRIVRDPGPGRGYVVDWIEWPNFPVFNLADSAIVCSGALMVYLAFRGIGPDGSTAKS